jgi:hypothetical protein
VKPRPRATYKINGFNLTLLEWEEPFALYQVNNGKKLRGFEVQKLKWIYSSLTNSELWVHPSNEQFGSRGWSYETYDSAIRDFKARLLESRVNVPLNNNLRDLPTTYHL